jgi:hypothetical protein
VKKHKKPRRSYRKWHIWGDYYDAISLRHL